MTSFICSVYDRTYLSNNATNFFQMHGSSSAIFKFPMTKLLLYVVWRCYKFLSVGGFDFSESVHFEKNKINGFHFNLFY